jgi:RNA polymerase-binding protein DksA
MNKAEMDGYRQQLFALGQRLKEKVSDLEGEALRETGGEPSGSLSNAPLHPADLGTDNFEQAVAIGLLQNEDQLLEEVAAALDRMEKGTYGTCEECHQEIGRERLRALPYTRFCVDCARKYEAETPR